MVIYIVYLFKIEIIYLYFSFFNKDNIYNGSKVFKLKNGKLDNKIYYAKMSVYYSHINFLLLISIYYRETQKYIEVSALIFAIKYLDIL